MNRRHPRDRWNVERYLDQMAWARLEAARIRDDLYPGRATLRSRGED